MADEYISREAALRAIENKRNEYVDKAWKPVVGGRYQQDELFTNAALGCRAADEEVKTVPAADVKPVVRGKWVADRYGGTTCSVCGLSPDENRVDNADDWGRWEPFPPYCPNCGADMRVEHE